MPPSGTSHRFQRDLGDTSLSVSALGYGSANFGRSVNRKRALFLLETAYDSGINYFDTAPLYGFGRAEGHVGHFARGKRERVVLATKFGLEARSSLSAGALRAIASRTRRKFQRSRPESSPSNNDVARKVPYTVGALEKSIEGSLRTLDTDYIDVLILHEPQIAEATEKSFLESLASLRERAIVRYIGVSGPPERVLAIAQQAGDVIDVLQSSPELLDRSLHPQKARIIHSVFVTALRQREGSDETRGQTEIERGVLLRRAVRKNEDGVTLIGSLNPLHIRENVETVQDEFYNTHS